MTANQFIIYTTYTPK